jgi:hypothetical protein
MAELIWMRVPARLIWLLRAEVSYSAKGWKHRVTEFTELQGTVFSL